MTNNVIAILVVLAPGMVCAVLGLIVEVAPKIRHRLYTMMHSASDVHWLSELVSHSAFYGTVIAAVLGFKKEAPETTWLAAIWFVVLLYLSRLLSNRHSELEEKERGHTHRKNAGMSRSVIRSELERATQRNKEDWVD